MSRSGKPYEKWREDFALVGKWELNFSGMECRCTGRFPDMRNTTGLFADLAFAEQLRLDIAPIVDLCHFGVPDWIGNFQNEDFPELFAAYARAFAERFPWVQLYTPVDEMCICATFSARYGWWNEQLTSEKGSVAALKNFVKANVFAMRAYLASDEATFIQGASLRVNGGRLDRL